MTHMELITEDIEGYIKTNDLLQACIRISTDVEFILYQKLFFEKSVHLELMENWTLGTYIKLGYKLGIIDEKTKSNLSKFNELRNKIVHNRMFFNQIKENENNATKLKAILVSMCKFIKNTKIENGNLDLQKKYYEFYKDKGQNIQRYLSWDFDWVISSDSDV